jgi:hypothetical protein
VRDVSDPRYAGETGRERAGEHWNARVLRETAGDGTRPEPPQTAILVHESGFPYAEVRTDAGVIRVFTGMASPAGVSAGPGGDPPEHARPPADPRRRPLAPAGGRWLPDAGNLTSTRLDITLTREDGT